MRLRPLALASQVAISKLHFSNYNFYYKRLCNALFGRTGSQWLVVDVFGEKGRQHRSTDSNPEAVENMAARYRRAAGRHWPATMSEIERVKHNYQAGIKASRDKNN